MPLRMAAAPPVDIWLGARSRNTRENAQFTNQLLRRYPGVDTLVLVTSAFHMRWTEGRFEQVGLPVLTLPAVFQSSGRALTPDYWLLPSPEVLEPAAARNGRLGHVQDARLVLKQGSVAGFVPVAW